MWSHGDMGCARAPEGETSEQRTVLLAVDNSTARRSEQQRKHATPMVSVRVQHYSVVNCRVAKRKRDKNQNHTQPQNTWLRLASWWLFQFRPDVILSRLPYFLLFVLCLSTCRCSFIAAFFLPVIGNELFPSSRPFLFAPLRFLRVRASDGADDPCE